MSSHHAAAATHQTPHLPTASTVAATNIKHAEEEPEDLPEHIDHLKELKAKENEMSIDELARALFSEFDREKRGYISFHDLAAILLERSNEDHDSHTSDLEIELLIESRNEVQQMLKILDPKQTGHIDYADFFRAFTFFEFFRLGYKKGFQVLHAAFFNNFKNRASRTCTLILTENISTRNRSASSAPRTSTTRRDSTRATSSLTSSVTFC
jgi:hypothetical protein